MNRRTFIKGAIIAAATPTVTAFADTADHVTLASLLDLHSRAYEADSVEWRKLNDIQEEAQAADTLPVSREPELLRALGYHEQRERCENSRIVVRRMEAAIFAYQLQFIQSIFGQIAQARNVPKVGA